MEWDEAQTFPLHVFQAMGEMGFMGMLVDPKYGGSGLGYAEYITVIDEISQVCGSIGLSLAAHNSLCTQHILWRRTIAYAPSTLTSLVQRPKKPNGCHG